MGRNVREDLGGVGGGKEYDKNKLYEILKKKKTQSIVFQKDYGPKCHKKFFQKIILSNFNLTWFVGQIQIF